MAHGGTAGDSGGRSPVGGPTRAPLAAPAANSGQLDDALREPRSAVSGMPACHPAGDDDGDRNRGVARHGSASRILDRADGPHRLETRVPRHIRTRTRARGRNSAWRRRRHAYSGAHRAGPQRAHHPDPVVGLGRLRVLQGELHDLLVLHYWIHRVPAGDCRCLGARGRRVPAS